jgi:hypothetical protein
MTWTLRFYDDAETEIAWAQIEDDGTYDYAVTHPEIEDRNLECMLNDWQWVYSDEVGNGETVVGDPPILTIKQTPIQIEVGLAPEEHLWLIQDELFDYDNVSSTTLNDE